MRASLPYHLPAASHVEVGVGRRLVLWPFVLSLYPAALLLMTLAGWVAPARDGWRAVVSIFAPHLYLLALPLLLPALRRELVGINLLRGLVLACACVFGLGYMPNIAPSQDPLPVSGARFSVLTWNVFAGNRHMDEVAALLATRPADVVALQEADVEALMRDERVPAAYEYRLTGRDGMPPGMAILSTFPIVANGSLDGSPEVWDIPRLGWSRLDLGDGREVTVASAHPISTYYSGDDCALPVCYEPSQRDRQIEALRRDYISPKLKSGEPFVLAGDFNVTEREAAYGVLADGLGDAFKARGEGFGSTWRPPFMMSQPFGLLRIDYLFTSPGVRALSVQTDCTPRRSDHCTVTATFALDY